MPSSKQLLGKFGEQLIAKQCGCPKCKRRGTLKPLPTNFKCADLICDFCGYVAQVKTAKVDDLSRVPRYVLGAAWGPQRERNEAGIYLPLYLVLVKDRQTAVYYLPADLQTPQMFKPRNPLSATARRAGWQGFYYDLGALAWPLIRVF